MPVLLILVIQGSIWINFSIPAVLNQPLFFMRYLVVSSIQMGANIDYAIVIASRYQKLKNTMSHRDAMIETLNFAFPTVITSGTILAVAGTLIGQMTSEAAIVGIGQSLGRGTIISMLFVLFVLPQILLLGGGLADKTSISMPTAARTHQSRERVFVVGLVTGEISGTVSGLVRASVDGNVNLRVISGRIADRRRRLYPDLPRRLRRTGTQDHRPVPDGELLGVRPFQPRGERCVRPEPHRRGRGHPRRDADGRRRHRRPDGGRHHAALFLRRTRRA